MLKSILIVPFLWFAADAARILGVFPEPSHSHQVAFRTLMMELARRGHEVIIFTTALVNDPTLRNYTEVELRFSTPAKRSDDMFSTGKAGTWALLEEAYNRIEPIMDETLSHPVMQRLISPNSGEKFDLIIVECLFHDALYALSIRFNAPLIGMTSVPMLPFHHYKFGNPLLPAYSPDLLLGSDDNMSLWERFTNLYYYLRQIYWYRYTIMPIQEKISRKYFGDSIPPAHQLVSNVSLLMANFHPYIYPRANIPGIIPIAGYRQTQQNKNLPQDLEEILNDAKQGCIYFSLGTNVKSYMMSNERRNMLMRVFAKLPYKILWKFELDHVENKPNNVIIRKWLPQREVLAHPNIRLFIYQGGLQSTEEAMENGVPVIGFPIFGDQLYNMKKLISSGVGKMLTFADISEDEFRKAVLEVITNSSYKKNMLKLRDLLRDLPYDPLDNAVWWAEHVIRHKGAPHLRNKSRDMPWYQVLLLDIIAITLGAVALVVFIIVKIKRYLIGIIRRRSSRTKSMHSKRKQQ